MQYKSLSFGSYFHLQYLLRDLYLAGRGIKELISCVVKVTASQDIGGQILYF